MKKFKDSFSKVICRKVKKILSKADKLEEMFGEEFYYKSASSYGSFTRLCDSVLDKIESKTGYFYPISHFY